MNELIETIDIIGKHLLQKPDFCGSTQGRRLTELLYRLTGKSRSRDMAPSSSKRVELVARTLVLPVDLDVQLSTFVSKSGISSDELIAAALSAFIAQDALE